MPSATGKQHKQPSIRKVAVAMLANFSNIIYKWQCMLGENVFPVYKLAVYMLEAEYIS